MSLLQMSFLGTVIILLIVVLRAVLINRLPKKTFLILWWIALIRLISSIFHKISHKYLFSVAEYLF